MNFFIEQIAIAPKDPQAAKKLLSEMGAVDWAEDQVVANGKVFGEESSNIANLSFNYDIANSYEFEVLDYVEGDNWVSDGREGTVCHLGMHCSADQLRQWCEFFAARGIAVAQEVFTQTHTNPTIRNERRYNYVIFDTKDILGVDIKFIVRKNVDGSDYDKLADSPILDLLKRCESIGDELLKNAKHCFDIDFGRLNDTMIDLSKLTKKLSSK